MRTRFGVIVGALLVGTLVGLAGASASATPTYGSWSPTFGGGSGAYYNGRNGVDAANRTAGAVTKANYSVAPGWLGARPIGVIQSSGAVCVDAGWRYNSSSTSSYGAWYSNSSCNGHAVYGYGASRGWDTTWSGNYAERWNSASPAQNF